MSEKMRLDHQTKMSISIFIFIYTIHLATWRCTQSLDTLAPIGTEKSATEIFIGEKENLTNKGTDKQYAAVFCYKIQLITIKLCTKFQNPK